MYKNFGITLFIFCSFFLFHCLYNFYYYYFYWKKRNKTSCGLHDKFLLCLLLNTKQERKDSQTHGKTLVRSLRKGILISKNFSLPQKCFIVCVCVYVFQQSHCGSPILSIISLIKILFIINLILYFRALASFTPNIFNESQRSVIQSQHICAIKEPYIILKLSTSWPYLLY